MTDTDHQIAMVKIIQLYRAFADANRFGQADAGWLVAHIGTVGEVIGAKFAGKQLPQKGGLVGSTSRGIKFHAVGIVITAQPLTNFIEGGLPLDGLIGIRYRIVFHWMRQPAFAFKLVGAALPQFADRVGRENSGVVRLLVASHDTAFAPFSQNSKEDVCLGSGQAQPGQSKPLGWLTLNKAITSCFTAICQGPQPPAAPS